MGLELVGFSPPSRRSPVECDFSPDGLFEAQFRVENTSNLREGEQLQRIHEWRVAPLPIRSFVTLFVYSRLHSWTARVVTPQNLNYTPARHHSPSTARAMLK